MYYEKIKEVYSNPKDITHLGVLDDLIFGTFYAFNERIVYFYNRRDFTILAFKPDKVINNILNRCREHRKHLITDLFHHMNSICN